jgi:hypothetical protein
MRLTDITCSVTLLNIVLAQLWIIELHVNALYTIGLSMVREDDKHIIAII